MVYTYGYVTNPYCGPSRAALMTGRYQQRFGFEANPPYAVDNPFSGLPESETIMAKRLEDADYRTGMVGKWHLGSHTIHHSNNRGFDFFFGFLGGGSILPALSLWLPVQTQQLKASEAEKARFMNTSAEQEPTQSSSIPK